MFKEYLITKAFDEILDFIKSFDNVIKKKLLIDRHAFERNITLHTNFINNWSSEISFRDLQNSKDISSSYVNLDLYLTPKKTRLLADKSIIPFDQILTNMTKNLVILGDPGAGKTTSMKYVCYKLFTDENFLKGQINFPIVIRLRDLKILTKRVLTKNKDEVQLVEIIESVFFRIYELLGLQVEINLKTNSIVIGQDNYTDHYTFLKNLIITTLDELNILLILDGLDEVHAHKKSDLVTEIQILFLELNKSKVILTSRPGDYNYSIENSNTYEICLLNDNQIKQFIEKWLNQKNIAEKIYAQVIISPFKDTLAKPLTLAHLCAIYERYGQIPEKPRTLYKKIVMLLIEEWDSQRNIQRLSRYSGFETDRKFDFLCNLSFYLTTKLERVTFDDSQFKQAYINICKHFNLPSSEGILVAAEIESHTGLFLQTGFDQFEFAHKSLQEYLCAEYIVRLPQIPFDKTLLFKLPNELALATAISSNPTNYLANLLLVNIRFHIKGSYNFLKSYFTRLVSERPDFVLDPILLITLLNVIEPIDRRESVDFLIKVFNSLDMSRLVKVFAEHYTARFDQEFEMLLFNYTFPYENEVTMTLPEIISIRNSSTINYLQKYLSDFTKEMEVHPQ